MSRKTSSIGSLLRSVRGNFVFNVNPVILDGVSSFNVLMPDPLRVYFGLFAQTATSYSWGFGVFNINSIIEWTNPMPYPEFFIEKHFILVQSPVFLYGGILGQTINVVSVTASGTN